MLQETSNRILYLVFSVFILTVGIVPIILSSVIYMVYFSSGHVHGFAVYGLYFYSAILSILYLFINNIFNKVTYNLINEYFGGDDETRPWKPLEVLNYIIFLGYTTIACPIIGYFIYKGLSFNVTLVVFPQ